jgi:hypothetical protein
MRWTILAALGPVATARAQPLPLVPGQRVRVTVPTLSVLRQNTTFRRLDGDTLVLSSASYPLSSVTRLESDSGRKPHASEGAGIGYLVAAGGSFIAVQGSTRGTEARELRKAVIVGGSSVIASVVAAIIGGLFWESDRWDPVPLDRLRVSVVRRRDGRLGLGLSVAF